MNREEHPYWIDLRQRAAALSAIVEKEYGVGIVAEDIISLRDIGNAGMAESEPRKVWFRKSKAQVAESERMLRRRVRNARALAEAAEFLGVDLTMKESS